MARCEQHNQTFRSVCPDCELADMGATSKVVEPTDYHMDTHDGCKRELVGSNFYDHLMLKATRGSREFSGLTPMLWWRSERERLTDIARSRGIL